MSSSVDRDILAILRQVCSVLEHLTIPYVLGGSLAASPYGLSRLTKDIDIAAAIREEHIDPLFEALHAEYYIVPEAVYEAIQRLDMFNLIHLQTIWKVDVFILGDDAWSQNQISRRSRRQFSEDENELGPFTTSLEDIVLQKLKWLDEGHGVSHQQWQDVQLLLRRNADWLDLDYSRAWAQRLGIWNVLSKALAEAGLGEGNEQ